MALWIREKDGKTTTISALQMMKSPGKVRAQIDEIKKRHKQQRSSSAATSPENKKEGTALGSKKDDITAKTEEKPSATTEGKAEDNPDDIEKKRTRLFDELGLLDIRASRAKDEDKKEKIRASMSPPRLIFPRKSSRDKSAGTTSKQPFTGIAEGGKFLFDRNFDITDMPDADPTFPGAKADAPNFEDLGVPERERPKLTLAHLSLAMRLNEYYDKIKYEAIASQFFEHTSIRVKPEEMKYMVEEGLASSKST